MFALLEYRWFAFAAAIMADWRRAFQRRKLV